MTEPLVEVNKTTKKVISIPEVTKDENVIKLYANGAQCQLTLADGNILFKHNENPICLITLNLSLIKNLRDNLDNLLTNYSKQIGVEIHSVDELSKMVLSNK